MLRRLLIQGATLVVAMLMPGTAWAEPPADPVARDGADPAPELVVPWGSSAVGTVSAGRSEDLRGWSASRAPWGGDLLVVVLAGVALALLTAGDRVASRLGGRSTRRTVRTLGARSPPLRLAVA